MILDRDNRTDEQVFDVVNELSANGIRGHVWNRKELESYFLLSGVISRISGASIEVVDKLLAEAVLEQKVDAQAQFIHRRQLTMVCATMDAMTVYRKVLPDFEKIWADPIERLNICPPKKALASLNRKLAAAKYKSVSARSISNNMRADEVVAEVRDLLLDIESAISGAR